MTGLGDRDGDGDGLVVAAGNGAEERGAGEVLAAGRSEAGGVKPADGDVTFPRERPTGVRGDRTAVPGVVTAAPGIAAAGAGDAAPGRDVAGRAGRA